MNAIKAYRGLEVQLHSFLNLALGGDDSSPSCTGHFPPVIIIIIIIISCSQLDRLPQSYRSSQLTSTAHSTGKCWGNSFDLLLRCAITGTVPPDN